MSEDESRRDIEKYKINNNTNITQPHKPLTPENLLDTLKEKDREESDKRLIKLLEGIRKAKNRSH